MPGVRMMYEKSILFEIVQRQNPSVPVEAFTLTIPPENMEIEEEQRVSETQTFGGVFVDDYGEGLKAIRISGHTGGSTLRLTYPHTTARFFNGKTAFFHFRDTLMRYKSVKSMETTYQNYDMYIYDLSTIPRTLDVFRFPLESLAEGYACYLKKFKMTRSKEKPLFYNYTIELTAIRPLGTRAQTTKPPVSSTNNPLAFLASIQRSILLARSYFAAIRSIRDQITNITYVLTDLTAQLTAFVNQTGDLLSYPVGLASRNLTMVKDLTLLIEASYTDIVTTAGKPEVTFYNILNIMRETSAASAALVVHDTTPDATGRLISKISSIDSRVQDAVARFQDITDQQAEIPSYALDQTVSSEETYSIYGYVIVVANASTTLERLSMEYFGSLDFIELIAVFSGIKGDSEITVGDQIRIPVISKGKNPGNNYIYSSVRGDIYGSDLEIDGNGNLVGMAAGDFSRVEGISNLVQAVNLRLNDKLGARMRLTLYGIRDSIGFARGEAAPISYVVSGIKDTLIQDPRINKVENIRLRLTGDVMQTSFDIHSIKVDETIPFKGGIK